jgi:hypothetical protein
METSSSIAPSTAKTAHTGTNTETDTQCNVTLDFGDMQEIPKHKVRNNF